VCGYFWLYKGVCTSVVMTALLWSEVEFVEFVLLRAKHSGQTINIAVLWILWQLPLILQPYCRYHKSFVGVLTLILTAVPLRLLQCHWHGSSTVDTVAFLLTIWQTHQHLRHRATLILCYFKYFASLWVNFMFSFFKWPRRLNCAWRYASVSVWWSGQLDDSCKFITFSTKPLLHSLLHVIYTGFSKKTLLHEICLFDQLIDWLIDRSITVHIWKGRKVLCLLYVGWVGLGHRQSPKFV
jgi:hypothetical protein